jgi:hypothetical protein
MPEPPRAACERLLLRDRAQPRRPLAPAQGERVGAEATGAGQRDREAARAEQEDELVAAVLREEPLSAWTAMPATSMSMPSAMAASGSADPG